MPNVYTQKELEDISGGLYEEKSFPDYKPALGEWVAAFFSPSKFCYMWVTQRTFFKQYMPQFYKAMLCEKDQLALYACSTDPNARAVAEWRLRKDR